MGTVIILVAVAAALGVGLVVFGIVSSEDRSPETGVRASYRTLADVREQLRRRFEPTGTPSWIRGEQQVSRLQRDLVSADLELRPYEFRLIQVGFALVFAIIGLLRFGISPEFLILGVLGYVLPSIYLRNRRGHRLRQFDANLPRAMELIANSMKAGQSVAQSLTAVTDNAGPPVSDEFALARREIELGASVESALNNMVRRIGSHDLRLMVMVITIQRSVGGDLPAILVTLADTMRQREEMRAEINAATAQSRATALIITLLPIVAAIALYFIVRDYFRPMLVNPLGWFMLGLAALLLFIGVGAALGAYLLTVGIIASRAADATTLARERLARQEVGLGQSAVALQLEKPLRERLLGPMRRWLDRQMTRMTPEAQAANFRRQLDFVGNPLNLDPAGLQTLRIAAAAALGAIGTAIGVFIGTPFAIGLALVIGVEIGFYVPVVWLDQLVRERRSELEASLPNALDVVAISMEAGLGLDRALEQLVRHQDDSLTLLVARALREIQLGRPRGAAFEEMAEATGIDDFTSLVRGILYAERTGVPIARTIAAHAAQMRVKRRLKIRTEAARASLKILIPTVGCVFPTLWLILLGPALLVVLTLGH